MLFKIASEVQVKFWLSNLNKFFFLGGGENFIGEKINENHKTLPLILIDTAVRLIAFLNVT